MPTGFQCFIESYFCYDFVKYEENFVILPVLLIFEVDSMVVIFLLLCRYTNSNGLKTPVQGDLSICVHTSCIMMKNLFAYLLC